jgi:hypothetical protein
VSDGPAEEAEPLARFLFSANDVRPDGTVRVDRFMPYKWVELSMSRHLSRPDEELWSVGDAVGKLLPTPGPCVARADVVALVFLRNGLQVVALATHEDPGHANVVGYPSDKPAQKLIALEVVKHATCVRRPAKAA